MSEFKAEEVEDKESLEEEVSLEGCVKAFGEKLNESELKIAQYFAQLGANWQKQHSIDKEKVLEVIEGVRQIYFGKNSHYFDELTDLIDRIKNIKAL